MHRPWLAAGRRVPECTTAGVDSTPAVFAPSRFSESSLRGGIPEVHAAGTPASDRQRITRRGPETVDTYGPCPAPGERRSEERRVGKECRARSAPQRE